MQEDSSSNSLGERVPKLRFPGFEGEWDSELFSELFDFLSNNTLSRAELSETGTIRNIHYGDILVKYTDVINVDDEIIPFVSNASEGKVKCDMLRTGDVIIADTAEDDTVGKATEIINHNNKSVVSGLHTMPCRPNRDFISSFLGYYINSNAYHLQLYPYMQGTKVTSISKANIGKTLISFPSTNEQKKIVKLFNLIEKKILLQKRLVEFLKLYKRGLLAKLFPQKGESGPQYRFAGFTGDWEQRKAKELCSISTGKSNTQDKIDEGIYPFYVRSPIIERSNRYLYDEEAVLTVGDGVGTGKVFHYVNGKYDLHQRVYRMFGFSDEVSAKYFYYYFSKHFYERVMAMTAKTSVDSVRYEMIADMDFSIPNLEEQKKVSAYFEHLDRLITLHQCKCDTYQALKKSLLQQMFI